MRQLSPNLSPPREAPAASLFRPHPPGHVNDPVLEVGSIQGNIIGGFNKDYQTFLFLRIRQDGDAASNLANFKTWLADFVPSVATAEEVLAFNRLFKRIRSRRKVDSRTIQATWINIAFSFNALKRLKSDAGNITDDAFKEGLAARAVQKLNDPREPKAEGHPQNWLFGGPGREADVVIIVGSDDPTDLDATVERIETDIYDGRGPKGQQAPSGLEVIYKQQGATLPAPLTGHEHFGFLDGVSQPGIRGVVSSVTKEVLTPRQNPSDPDQGKPGQDLLWPGEFVFGYPGQDANKKVSEPGPVAEAGVDWAKNGAFLVIRRLRQDVPGFHAFLDAVAQQNNKSADLMGARLVGRWKSGAPVMRTPDEDLPALAEDDCANNNFEFQDSTAAIPASSPGMCSDNFFPQSPGDKTGARCPFAGHIRKTYPRDDEGTLSSGIGEESTQTHRLLRRGIPFGSPFIPPKDPNKNLDDGNRGLMFAAYQTSIVEQFEFVQGSWANNPEFKDKSVNGKLVSGHDLIIGQSNGQNGSRERRCIVTLDGQAKEIVAPRDWVIPTGGGYFFAPSIDAMTQMAKP